MGSDAKVAGDLAGYAAAGMSSVESTMNLLKAFTMYFMKLLENQESRQQLMDFYEVGLAQDSKLHSGEKLGIVTYSITPEYAKQLYDICRREQIGHISTQTHSPGDQEGIHDLIWVYHTQQKDLHRAVTEAKARSGFEREIPREMTNFFINELIKEKNPMLEIKDIPMEKYIALRRDIQKLDQDMRFTLFPKYHEENGRKLVDIGFLSKTEKLYDKRGDGFAVPMQYNCSEVMKGLLVKQQLIEQNEASVNYYNRIGQREQEKQVIIDELLKSRSSAALKYVVPVKVVRESKEVVFEASVKDSVCLDRDLTIRSFGKEDFVVEDESSLRNSLDRKITEFTEKGNESGKGYHFVVMDANEFRGLESNRRLKKNDIKFLKEFDDPSKLMEDTVLADVEQSAEQMIDIINKNKEKFMLESDSSIVGIERFEEYQESTIENIILEQDHLEEAAETEINNCEANVKDAIAEMNGMEIVPVGKEDGFTQYLDVQTDRNREIPGHDIKKEERVR